VGAAVPPLKWSAPDIEGLVEFLVNEKDFNEQRVRAAVERINAAKSKSTQGWLCIVHSHSRSKLKIARQSSSSRQRISFAYILNCVQNAGRLESFFGPSKVVSSSTGSKRAFENTMKLEFEGQEDDIIKKIELGNVSLPTSNTLISGTIPGFRSFERNQFLA